MSHLETTNHAARAAGAVQGGTMRITVNGMTFSVSTEADLAAALSQLALNSVTIGSVPEKAVREVAGTRPRATSWMPRWLFPSRQHMS